MKKESSGFRGPGNRSRGKRSPKGKETGRRVYDNFTDGRGEANAQPEWLQNSGKNTM